MRLGMNQSELDFPLEPMPMRILIKAPKGLTPALRLEEDQGAAAPAIRGRVKNLHGVSELSRRQPTVDKPVDQSLNR